VLTLFTSRRTSLLNLTVRLHGSHIPHSCPLTTTPGTSSSLPSGSSVAGANSADAGKGRSGLCLRAAADCVCSFRPRL
jgi:hypothetical protein